MAQLPSGVAKFFVDSEYDILLNITKIDAPSL